MRAISEISGVGQRRAAPALGHTPSAKTHSNTMVGIENSNLRKLPYRAHAILATYEQHPAKATTGLRIGTQARFIDAAGTANDRGFPLNTMLTLRWTSLFSDGDVNWLRAMPVSGRIDKLTERVRKWLGQRGLPALYIWVREIASPEHEHLHLAFHLRAGLRSGFADYVADLTGEPAAGKGHHARRSDGEFARGGASSWHLATDTHPERRGYFLAAYLGKGEPSQRMFRGKLIGNAQKPVRGRSFGGDQPDGKYDAGQGLITGTTSRACRCHISRPLLEMMRA